MSNDYSSPDFMGQGDGQYSGTVPGGDYFGQPAGNNFKKTMVGGMEEQAKGGQKRVTPLAGFLVSFSNQEVGEFWPLREGNNSIGTNKSNDIVLSEKHVSGDHAVINIHKDNANNCWFFDLADKSSSNGTYINGERLRIYHGYSLKNKDKIKIGEYELMLFVVDKHADKLGANPLFVGNKPSTNYSQESWMDFGAGNTQPGY
jgi:pSer/pThr/pTyr-binding forkhead associated (FHA) protein